MSQYNYSQVEICPVCHGSGKYKQYDNMNYVSGISYKEVTCHGCKGKGWIELVKNDYKRFPNWENHITFD